MTMQVKIYGTVYRFKQSERYKKYKRTNKTKNFSLSGPLKTRRPVISTFGTKHFQFIFHSDFTWDGLRWVAQDKLSDETRFAGSLIVLDSPSKSFELQPSCCSFVLNPKSLTVKFGTHEHYFNCVRGRFPPCPDETRTVKNGTSSCLGLFLWVFTFETFFQGIKVNI